MWIGSPRKRRFSSRQECIILRGLRREVMHVKEKEKGRRMVQEKSPDQDADVTTMERNEEEAELGREGPRPPCRGSGLPSHLE